MAERTRACVNLVVDAVLDRLRDIGDGDGWLSQPLTVKRATGIGDKKAPRPALLVKVLSWGPNLPLCNSGQHEVSLTLQIGVLASNAADPDEVIHNVVADAIRALSNGDVTFGGTVVGGLFVESYEADTDAADGGAGEGMGILTVKGLVHWGATAP
jgi:hypothetical protein